MMTKLKENKQLLVEGNDDLHVILALCKKYNIPKTFDIVDCNGINNLINSIPVRLKQSNVDTIGIIVDADTNLSRRWNEISDMLISKGYVNVPEIIEKEGLILIEEGKVKIGIWLMPNNDNIGMLEDFIKFLIPNEDLLLPIVESTLNSIESQELNRYKTTHKEKAVIHTWLAWQEDPRTPMGLSITKKYLDTNVKECSIFVAWLKELFK